MGRPRGLAGVESVTPISRPFKLTSREFKPTDTVVRSAERDDRRRHADRHGRPCSVESREQLLSDRRRRGRRRRHDPARRRLQAAHQPYSSRGWASKGSSSSPRRASGPGCRSSPRSWSRRSVDLVAEHADILQIGARNMQNYSAAHGASARSSRPVMLKRGLSATIEEWLMAAEYIVSAGNSAGHPLRARHPHVRDVHAQHARPRGRAAPAPPDPPAHRRRPVPRHRASAGSSGRWRWRRSPPAPTGIMVEVHPDPTRRSPTGSSRSRSSSSRRWRRSCARCTRRSAGSSASLFDGRATGGSAQWPRSPRTYGSPSAAGAPMRRRLASRAASTTTRMTIA